MVRYCPKNWPCAGDIIMMIVLQKWKMISQWENRFLEKYYSIKFDHLIDYQNITFWSLCLYLCAWLRILNGLGVERASPIPTVLIQLYIMDLRYDLCGTYFHTRTSHHSPALFNLLLHVTTWTRLVIMNNSSAEIPVHSTPVHRCLNARPASLTLAWHWAIAGPTTGSLHSGPSLSITILLCKAKRQYLLTCNVSRYCLLA